jgi:hypothetical protein
VVRITAPAGLLIGTGSYEQVGCQWHARVAANGPIPATTSVDLAPNRLHEG